MTRPKRQTAKQDIIDYRSCRAQIISNQTNRKSIVAAMAKCKEQYPAGSIAIECKRSAIKKYKKNPSRLKQALKKCKASQKRMAFNPKSPIPVRISKGKLFFAGMGLNTPRAFTQTQFGNYSCEHLDSYISSGESPEYFLFGNSPKVFLPFKKWPIQKVLKTLGINTNSDLDKPFVTSESFGQIYDFQDPSKIASYFPLSFCHFDRKLGRIYEGIKVYYLTDRTKQMITPYFGISFYQSSIQVRTKGLVSKVLKTLGPGYQVQVDKKQYIYIADAPFQSFDVGGDPYNLCRKPIKHKYIALIRKRQQTTKPEYLVVANIRNFCRFGHKLSKQFAK